MLRYDGSEFELVRFLSSLTELYHLALLQWAMIIVFLRGEGGGEVVSAAIKWKIAVFHVLATTPLSKSVPSGKSPAPCCRNPVFSVPACCLYSWTI